MATSTSTKAKGSTTTAGGRPALTSRAVLRDVEPGSTVECALCGERVKFQAKVRHRQVICNVYVNGSWNRVEHFHSDCYAQAGDPHGPVDTTPVVKSRIRAAEAKAADAKAAEKAAQEAEPAAKSA